MTVRDKITIMDEPPFTAIELPPYILSCSIAVMVSLPVKDPLEPQLSVTKELTARAIG